MTFSSFLTDQDRTLVLDASVLINLLSTEYARPILEALDAQIVVAENVVREIENGQVSGRNECLHLAQLIRDGLLKKEEVSGASLEIFFEIVSGSTKESLGDGEAATLALAYCNGMTAGIDEKKATRVAAERFGAVKIITTVDILASEVVAKKLDSDLVSKATLQALQMARMQVRPHQFGWIAQQIGETNLMSCRSLKKLARSAGYN